jgi:hypothetical protein
MQRQQARVMPPELSGSSVVPVQRQQARVVPPEWSGTSLLQWKQTRTVPLCRASVVPTSYRDATSLQYYWCGAKGASPGCREVSPDHSSLPSSQWHHLVSLVRVEHGQISVIPVQCTRPCARIRITSWYHK